MNAQSLARQLSDLLAVPESETVAVHLLALIDQEIGQAEQEMEALRKRYDAATEQALYQAIQEGRVTAHPAWEDYIVWKNKRAHIERLKQIAKGYHTDGDR